MGAVRFLPSISARGDSILTLTGAGADKGRALATVCVDLGIALSATNDDDGVGRAIEQLLKRD